MAHGDEAVRATLTEVRAGYRIITGEPEAAGFAEERLGLVFQVVETLAGDVRPAAGSIPSSRPSTVSEASEPWSAQRRPPAAGGHTLLHSADHAPADEPIRLRHRGTVIWIAVDQPEADVGRRTMLEAEDRTAGIGSRTCDSAEGTTASRERWHSAGRATEPAPIRARGRHVAGSRHPPAPIGLDKREREREREREDLPEQLVGGLAWTDRNWRR